MVLTNFDVVVVRFAAGCDEFVLRIDDDYVELGVSVFLMNFGC